MGDLSWKRIGRSILLIFLSVYVFFLLYAMLFADRIIFQPQPSSYADTEQILKIPLPDGTLISARYLSHPSTRYTILYSHGNAEDLGDIEEILQQFYARGFSIIAYDYSGYGTSQGKPSEQASYANIFAVYDYLQQERRLRTEHILLFGRSLGGGPSTELASRKTVGGLILESSFSSVFRVITNIPIFPFDKFDNQKKLSSVSCPVAIIHGKHDEVIPFWHGEDLYKKANPPKMNLWVEEAHHNDLFWVVGEQYWETLGQFVELVRSSSE
ncbi:MAG: alpha/beta hydrolase [bacterium]|nr:alpha/beta hydrolase [bacterium]